jgi:hypothetical protein
MSIELFNSTLAKRRVKARVQPVRKGDEVAFAGRIMPDRTNRRVVLSHQLPKLAQQVTKLVSISGAWNRAQVER